MSKDTARRYRGAAKRAVVGHAKNDRLPALVKVPSRKEDGVQMPFVHRRVGNCHCKYYLWLLKYVQAWQAIAVEQHIRLAEVVPRANRQARKVVD